MQTKINDRITIVDTTYTSILKSAESTVAEIDHKDKRINITVWPTFEEYVDIKEAARLLRFEIVNSYN